jgi:hypothetical protein
MEGGGTDEMFCLSPARPPVVSRGSAPSVLAWLQAALGSIPTPTTPKGSPRKSPPSPKLGLGSPPANARDAANPRPSPDAYDKREITRMSCPNRVASGRCLPAS